MMIKGQKAWPQQLAYILIGIALAFAVLPATVLANEMPQNGWITFPAEVSYVPSEGEADWYQITEPIEFDHDNNIIFTYDVGGQQWYRCALLRDEEGTPLVEDGSRGNESTLYGTEGNEDIVLKDSMTRNRTVTISGLAEQTTYQLYWQAKSANGRNPQCDVILTFTTGQLTYSYDFTNETGDRSGRGSRI